MRELFLTGLKPKVLEEFQTPYLVTQSGQTLDGELKLVGLPANEAFNLKQMSIIKKLDMEGNETYVYDDARLSALAIIKCLYHRASGEPLLDQLIPTQGPMAGNAADLPAVLGIDFAQFQQLSEDVLKFLGMGKSAVADAKKNSQTPQQDGSSDSTSNSQQDSAGSDPSTTS